MTTRGLIFDLQRAALHDGPGIRTTVFLKGCGLACWWCHNPEAMAPQPQWRYDREPPVRCGQEMTVAEVMKVVEQDRDFYAESGGGLTLSGGEPTMQFAFCRDLLRAAKAAGLHTCLDTCGYVAWAKLAALLPDTDLLLYDYKGLDPQRHRAYTGKSNQLIQRNLDRLQARGFPLILRYPLIPGYTDRPADLQGLVNRLQAYPEARAELLPYHEMGAHKRAAFRLPAARYTAPSPDPATLQAWEHQLAALTEATPGLRARIRCGWPTENRRPQVS